MFAELEREANQLLGSVFGRPGYYPMESLDRTRRWANTNRRSVRYPGPDGLTAPQAETMREEWGRCVTRS